MYSGCAHMQDIFNREVKNNSLVVVPYCLVGNKISDSLRLIAGVLKRDKVYYLDSDKKLRFIWTKSRGIEDNKQILTLGLNELDDNMREYYNSIFESLAKHD